MAEVVDVRARVLAANEEAAARLRGTFRASGALVLNLISSPGSGKTTLLETTVKALAGRLRLAGIEGDVATERDADRLRAMGIPAVQILTGGACHLDARQVRQGDRRGRVPRLRRPLHRERRQPDLPDLVRPRRGLQGRAAVGDGGGRQTVQVPGDLLAGRGHGDHEGGPAAARRVRPRSGARATGDARARRHGARHLGEDRRGDRRVVRAARAATGRQAQRPARDVTAVLSRQRRRAAVASRRSRPHTCATNPGGRLARARRRSCARSEPGDRPLASPVRAARWSVSAT